WVCRLEEEFWRQRQAQAVKLGAQQAGAGRQAMSSPGDRERKAGLVVSPLMDRSKDGITKSQVGFFDIVALPLFYTWAAVFPEALPLVRAVEDNCNRRLKPTQAGCPLSLLLPPGRVPPQPVLPRLQGPCALGCAASA
ncbi:hypothetical protein V8C86DRAFT_2445088, partial [Haematococcus lacustris]